MHLANHSPSVDRNHPYQVAKSKVDAMHSRWRESPGTAQSRLRSDSDRKNLRKFLGRHRIGHLPKLPGRQRKRPRGRLMPCKRLIVNNLMAESEGFEPPIALRLCLISSQVHSTGLCQLSVLTTFYRTEQSQRSRSFWRVRACQPAESCFDTELLLRSLRFPNSISRP